MPPDVVPKQVGPYRLGRVIGAGGMGVVYEGFDTNLDRDVAVKMLNVERVAATGRMDEIAARLAREAKAAARIKSAYVCQILALEHTPAGDTCIVMELVQGRTLKEALGGGKWLRSDEAVQIARQIALGMAAAHELGIVHRDLKPANIMLVEPPQDGVRVKILDFGLAKVGGADALTRSGDVVGTFRYMAPEQITSGEVDARTDIYALGALLFRVLVGRAPFEGEPGEILEAHLSTPVPRFLDVAPTVAVAPALEQIVRRCLEKERARRFSSMHAVAAALEDVSRASGEATLPPSVEPTLPRDEGASARIEAAAREVIAAARHAQDALAPAPTVVARSGPSPRRADPLDSSPAATLADDDDLDDSTADHQPHGTPSLQALADAPTRAREPEGAAFSLPDAPLGPPVHVRPVIDALHVVPTLPSEPAPPTAPGTAAGALDNGSGVWAEDARPRPARDAPGVALETRTWMGPNALSERDTYDDSAPDPEQRAPQRSVALVALLVAAALGTVLLWLLR